MQPRLLAVAGFGEGTVWPVGAAGLSLGRGETNDVRLTQANVSRRHCRIEAAADGFKIVDLDSQNGTFVDGVPVKVKALANGSTIRIASSEFVFLTQDVDTGFEAEPLTPTGNDADSLQVKTVRFARAAQLPGFGVDVGRMARDLSALSKVANVVNSMRDPELLQREFLRLIGEVVPADAGAVVLLRDLHDDSSGTTTTWRRDLDAKSVTDAKDADVMKSVIDVRQELVHRAVWEGSAIVTESVSSSGDVSHSLCVPLVAIERTIGVIFLVAHLPVSPFEESHVSFIDSVARIVAVTLENMLALERLREENTSLKQELRPPTRLVGESRQIAAVEAFVARLASADSNVLIRGESGTGKEVVASSLHQRSGRAHRPFAAINCAAIPETLFESELFGHEKGAFTGAAALRKGRLEMAEDGTLFLDEIAELPMPMQAKLLRVLQERTFERVGGSRPIAFRARVLAATNKDLEEAIKAGEFRRDLFYRLNVVSISIPPLRERRDDIPLLALYFAAQFSQRAKRPFKGISPEAREALTRYAWPGNVRELENAIERAIVMGDTGEILPEDLPPAVLETGSGTASRLYADVLNARRRELILSSLEETKQNYPAAAHLLGIHPKYLHRLVRNLGIRGSDTAD